MGKRKKQKGFARPKPIIGVVAPPVEYHEQIDTTKERLERLLAEILRYRLSERCFELFKRLCHIPPAVRLAVNLHVVLKNMCSKEIENVLVDGANAEERMVLLELDSSQVSQEVRQTAHSLLNMSARMKLVRVFGKLFFTLRTRRNHMLEERLLDE